MSVEQEQGEGCEHTGYHGKCSECKAREGFEMAMPTTPAEQEATGMHILEDEGGTLEEMQRELDEGSK